MDNNAKDNNRDPPDRREVQRRLRLARAGQQHRGGTLYRSLRPGGAAEGDTDRNNDARPEEAPSSMGNSRRVRGPAAAAEDAPAARNRSADDDNNNNEEADNNSNLRELVQHLREFCRDGDRKSPHKSAINMEKARNVLEACAGNVALAGQLYWDDYFASQQQQQQQQGQPNLPPLDAPSAAEAAEAAEEDPADEERRVRRRLESDFERLLPAPPPEQPPPEFAARPRRRRRRRRGPEAADPEVGGVVAAMPVRNNNNNNRHNVEEDVVDAEPAAARPAQRPPQRPQDNQALFVAARAVLGAGEDAAEGSNSVSDDEAGGILRMVRESSSRARYRGRRRRRSSSFDDSLDYIRARNALNAQIQADNDDRMDVERTKKRKSSGAGGGGGGDDSSDGEDSSIDEDGNQDDSDDEAYISDNDWMFRAPAPPPVSAPTSSSQPMENLRAPLGVLWNGLNTGAEDINKSSKAKKSDAPDKDDGKEKPSKKAKLDDKKDEKDGDNDGSGNNNNDPVSGAAKHPEIPSTWLHASFSPHSTAMGLAVKDPKLEDVTEHSWRLQQISSEGAASNPRRNNTIPLPYHCRGITAVLSIVTAAMHTGTSVQSGQVSCSTSRVPFLELSEELRKREFESRLIEALSALIFIAAKASMERKKKALAKKLSRKSRKRKRRMKKKDSLGEEEDTEVPDAQQKNLERKLKLCPVAWWKENQQNATVLPAEQWENSLDAESHTGPRILCNTTFSNMQDIRSFVLSNMQSFTSPGGLALLLETIVGIHGEGAVKRMLTKSHAASCSQETPCFLVRCTCEARQKKRLQDSSLSPASRRKMTNSLDTTPPGHECVSTELISLLLTGKIHSSWKGWTAGPLGFGFLSNKAGEVGSALTRPELPVWCVKGETCYSVLLWDHTNHGENLDEKVVAPASSVEGKAKDNEKKKKITSPSKPKAAPCMKISVCSSTSRSRDLQDAREFASKDQPGFVASFAHWNPWYGLRNLSGLRLITARPKWTPPAPSWVVQQYKTAPNAMHSTSLACERKGIVQQLNERRAAQSNVVSCDERENAESEQPVDNEAAINRIRCHPDDEMFYPKQHRLWRFDIGESEGPEVDPNSKPRGDHWVPYHSLSREEQMIVETKFGPQINRILWTRWPGATIDKFTPEGKKEPLPIV